MPSRTVFLRGQQHEDDIVSSTTNATATTTTIHTRRPDTKYPTSLHLHKPGRRRGLLIGINYQGHGDDFYLGEHLYGPLTGPHQDVEAMKAHFTSWGWTPEEFVVLKDGEGDAAHQPTKENIMKEVEEMVKWAQPGDHLFFQFSGHGGQVPDEDGDEEDGKDEVIWTSDLEMIVDDELHALVRKLPPGCRLMTFVDACCSGTMFDLTEKLTESPMSTSQTLIVPGVESTGIGSCATLVDEDTLLSKLSLSAQPAEAAFLEVARVPLTAPLKVTSPYLKARAGDKPVRRGTEISSLSPKVESPGRSTSLGYTPELWKKYVGAEVISFSACKDSEFSEEVIVDRSSGTRMGAFTKSFIEVTGPQSEHTYQTFIDKIKERVEYYRRTVKGHEERRPSKVQITSSRQMRWDDLLKL